MIFSNRDLVKMVVRVQVRIDRGRSHFTFAILDLIVNQISSCDKIAVLYMINSRRGYKLMGGINITPADIQWLGEFHVAAGSVSHMFLPDVIAGSIMRLVKTMNLTDIDSYCPCPPSDELDLIIHQLESVVLSGLW